MPEQDPLFDDVPEITTGRLLLRRLRPEDLESLHEQNSDPDVARFMGWLPSQSLVETVDFLDELLERYDRHYPTPWGIELRSSGRLIGRCGFETWHLSDSRAEVAFALARQYWSAGYMSEALGAVIRHAFETMQLNRLEGRCDSDNRASARVMQKNGMLLEGIHRQQQYSNGSYRDMMVFAILREEWQAQQTIM